MLDAGFSSLATFVVGLYAVRALEPASLGAYAFVFTTFLLAAVLPTQMLFTPLEIAVLSLPRERRLPQLRVSLAIGAGPALVTGLCLAGWLFFAPPAPRHVLAGLTLTGMAAAFLSPVQDHLRRMLHITGLSWRAAAVSAVQLTTVLSALVVLRIAGLAPWWLPLGALAVGNLVSLLAGLGLAGIPVAAPASEVPSFRTLLGRGHWLLMAELVPYGSAFIVSGLVTQLSGAATLGYAEAARVVAQPILVATAGLSVVFSPRSIVAAQLGRLEDARQISTIFARWIPLLGVAYLVFVGWEWPGSPVPSLAPSAYVIPGLVAATVLANIAVGSSYPLRFELLGAGRELGLTQVEAVGNGLRILIGCLAGAVGAVAIPIGLLALAGVRWFGCRFLLRQHYLPPTTADTFDSAKPG